MDARWGKAKHKLHRGMVLISVNGKACDSYEHTQRLLRKNNQGAVTLLFAPQFQDADALADEAFQREKDRQAQAAKREKLNKREQDDTDAEDDVEESGEETGEEESEEEEGSEEEESDEEEGSEEEESEEEGEEQSDDEEEEDSEEEESGDDGRTAGAFLLSPATDNGHDTRGGGGAVYELQLGRDGNQNRTLGVSFGRNPAGSIWGMAVSRVSPSSEAA